MSASALFGSNKAKLNLKKVKCTENHVDKQTKKQQRAAVKRIRRRHYINVEISEIQTPIVTVG